MQSKLAQVGLISILVLVLTAGLGVAGQNIGLGLAVAGFLTVAFATNLRTSSLKSLFFTHRWQFVAGCIALLWIGSLLVSTSMNTAVAARFGFIPGYLAWAVLPALVLLSGWRPTGQQRNLVGTLTVCVLVGVAATALAQYFLGWKLSGLTIVESEHRGRGFYSHPLSLAYFALLVFPVTLIALLKNLRSWMAWIAMMSCVAIVFASASRTVQMICLAVTLFNVIFMMRGRIRLVVLGALFTCVVLTAVTSNPISDRFRRTFAGQEDRTSHYADDRLVFWHAHWLMFKDRPVLGHGDAVDEFYRKPWYEQLETGGEFRKIYPAHNMYLQVAVNAGVVGLGLFVAWWVMQIVSFASSAQGSRGVSAWTGSAAVQSLMALMVGGVTQNAFQDSVVRNCLAIGISWMVLCRVPGNRLHFIPR